MKSFKSILPWLIAVVALVAAYAFYSSSASKETELASLREGQAELEQLRSDNAELAKLKAQSDELARLRKDNEDLLRLRNEIRQLREDKQQLTRQVQAAEGKAAQASRTLELRQQEAQTAQAQLAAAQVQQAAAAQAQQQLQQFQQRYGIAPQPGANPQAAACINHLRQIDGAKQQWALEHRKPANAVPTAQEVAAYLKDNALPTCPAGGVYTLNSAGARPACNIPGHALPQ